MIRKIKNIVYWVISLGYLVAALFFISAKTSELQCTGINIDIKGLSRAKFVSEQDIRTLINTKQANPIGMVLDSINLNSIESIISDHPSVKSAEVYKTVNGTVCIDITQRNPIVRIFNKTGEGYYLDEDGFAMPLSQKYTAHVLVVSGEINKPFRKNKGIDFSFKGETATDEIGLDEIFELSSFIRNNDFWNAQIEQVYINEKGEFELIPRVGAQTIFLGRIDNYEEKFDKLMLLYTRAFNKTGWRKYESINLKYKNQVVCKKK